MGRMAVALLVGAGAWGLGCGIDRPGLAALDAGEDVDVRMDGGTDAGRLDAGLDARPSDGDAEDAGRDAPMPDAGAPCPGELAWRADFDRDPTTLDVNGDGVDDWVVRGGGAFPVSELSDGVWRASPWITLDTRPKVGFTGRTYVDVRMRAVATGGEGAVFWINVDYSDTGFAAIWVSVVRQSDETQSLRIYVKPNNGLSTEVFGAHGLSDGFVRIELTIDPATDRFAARIDGDDVGAMDYPTFGPPNDDRFATLLGWSATSEFDYVQVRTCGAR